MDTPIHRPYSGKARLKKDMAFMRRTSVVVVLVMDRQQTLSNSTILSPISQSNVAPEVITQCNAASTLRALGIQCEYSMRALLFLLKVIATAADPNLGGRDFDHLITEHFVQEFKNTFKVREVSCGTQAFPNRSSSKKQSPKSSGWSKCGCKPGRPWSHVRVVVVGDPQGAGVWS